jgi:chromosome segregation ATPase
LAETAALFRQECFALDHLVEELYRDVEQLRDELAHKGDEIEENRRKLAERGRQLAEQRKESGRLVHLLEQQDARMSEALGEIKTLREQSSQEREEARERETARLGFLEQQLRAAEAERDQLRHELNLLQATVGASGAVAGSGESLAPLMAELGDMRRQLGETHNQLGEARTQLSAAIEQSAMAIQQSAASAAIVPDAMPALMAEFGEMRRQLGETQSQLRDTQSQLGEARTQLATAIERATAAAAQAPPPMVITGDGRPADEETLSRLASIERERVELESELELVRTRATELQEVVNQQRRELVEQRADITTELRLLRELVEQRAHAAEEFELDEEAALVGAGPRGESMVPTPDPVVSSVMAQFARLQKDVAQRRKKK